MKLVSSLVPELTKQILKTATLYEKNKIDQKRKKNKDYKYPDKLNIPWTDIILKRSKRGGKKFGKTKKFFQQK
jgi:hypothetical protein